MASEMIGRAKCPECGFESAHVKIKTDKEGAHPYRHCPECGAQYFPRNKHQAEHLRAKVKGQTAPAAAPAAVEKDEVPPAKADPAPPAKTRVVFGVRMPA